MAAHDAQRGPRWGLRPPDPPELRAAALATADTILTAPDLDTAATALTPWTELTPTTNDGPLGWLGDRTVMTPTLTRLVLSARSRHRRLSHQLDTHPPTGAPMKINHKVIPQVIPRQSYTDHLVGACDSGEETVRLFASHSLARMHPDITTWAGAAQALEMPGPMGTGARAPAHAACWSPPRTGRRGSGQPSRTSTAATTARPRPRSSTAST